VEDELQLLVDDSEMDMESSPEPSKAQTNKVPAGKTK